MAAWRRVASKGAVVSGVGLIGIGYYQRLPSCHADPYKEPAEGTATQLYRRVAAPVIMQIDPETAHVFALRSASLWQHVKLLGEPLWTGWTPLDWLIRPLPSTVQPSGPNLRQELFGGRLVFNTPVGIAAGFDKNAWLVPLYRLGALPGLGFSEVGSVSALPSSGNEQPRCFRLPSDEAVINRMGLNNEGAEAVAERLSSFEVLGRAGKVTEGTPPRVPVGVNIAKTHSPTILGEAALEDFATSFKTLVPYADFMVVNVSCPNTAEGKTFEDPEPLKSLVERIGLEKAAVDAPPPVLVKLSAPPDTEAGRERLRAMVEVLQAAGVVDGFVMSNTLSEREGLLSKEGLEAASVAGRGGLSGKPVHHRSIAAIRTIYEATGGNVPIIGVGGIDSPEAAYAAVRAGASLVEVYTGMVYKGPGLLNDISVGFRRLLERDGFASVADAVGVDAVKA
eukprot:TRINITY_DN70770_c0_g1_i1.p1 TRINITY_DN70770_c0_g1~~TRINITY_DN70770_c0_g1_i1.p1  ORF type:complete len:477 (-),score=98.51 TRINITY_DN70770_c0_g1_i1:139-1491(-)